MGNHEERAHALLSASSSDQWLNCTRSARAQEHIEDTSSDFALEGTKGHEYSEAVLREHYNVISKDESQAIIEAIEKHRLYKDDMPGYISKYVEFVTENAGPDALVLIENKVDYSSWAPEGYGTADIIILDGDTMHVIDLKYGQGILVSAERNAQLRLYALGALHDFGFLFSVKNIIMTIVQPRRDHISQDRLSKERLLVWADEFVKPKADLAFEGQGSFIPGDHCKWCKIRATCRARAAYNLVLAHDEFEVPETLSNSELQAVLDQASGISSWIKDIKEFIYSELKNGNLVEGFKLVEGRQSRNITDNDAVISKLISKGYKELDFMKAPTLEGVTKLTKLLGKNEFNVLVGPYIEMKAGKPKMAKASSKKQEWKPDKVEDDFKEVVK